MGETGVLRFLTKVTKTQQKGCHTPAANGQRLQHTGSIGQVQGESQSHRTLMTGLGIISQDYYYILYHTGDTELCTMHGSETVPGAGKSACSK